MKRPFREHHLFEILNAFEARPLPLDHFLRNYFRAHPAVGSKDRKVICEALYAMIRWRGLFDYLTSGPTSWETRYARFLQCDPMQSIGDTSIPSHIRVSFPKDFYQLLEESLGQEQAFAFCLASNATAPTTVRTNRIKTSREKLLSLWSGQYPVRPCQHSPDGIAFEQKINFFGLPEFKEGCFEVQDEASQLIAAMCAVKPGDHFLDFCSGSGGKSLAIAPHMQGKGQLYLHDIRLQALVEAKKRLKRAGIQNAQLILPDSTQLKSIKGRIDWVLVDAPCSGTGTLRRNPDMKWKFDKEMVPRLVLEQRAIFQQALSYLKPTGRIVYATCSVLPQENEQQTAYFLESYPLELVGTPFHSTPKAGEMDGFYGAVFRKMTHGSVLK